MTQQHQVSITTRALAEGAIMASIAGLLGIIGIYIPVLSLLTGLVWAIPIILLVMRHNLRLGFMGLLVSGGLISILAGPVQGVLLLVQLGGIGLLYGYCFKHRFHPVKTMLWGTVIAAISTAATIVLSAFIADLPIVQWITDMKMAFDEAINLYEKIGILDRILPPGSTPEQFKQSMHFMIDTFIPGAFVAGSMVAAFINYVIAGKVLRRLKYEIPELPPFREWHFPWYIIWGIILALGFLLAGKKYENQLIINISLNILYIYFPILLVSGLAVAVFYLHKYKLSPVVKGIIIFASLAYLNVVMMILLVIGLFDPLIDYRRLAQAKKDQG